MTEGTSQGLFIVVAIVIFGIFVSLSYTLFGKQGLSNDLENIFLDATGQVNDLHDKTIPIDEDLFTFNENTRTITGYSNDGPKDLVIPRSINGVTVRKIGPSAFTNKGLTSVKFPDTVNEIEHSKIAYKGAFTGNKLGNLTIPGNIKLIGSHSFTNAGITNLTLEEGVESVWSHTFYMNSFKELVYPSSMRYSGASSFVGLGLTKIELNEGLEHIDFGSFRGSNLKEVTIPKSVKKISQHIWWDSKGIEKINVPIELKKTIELNDKMTYVKTTQYSVEKGYYNQTFFPDEMINYY